MLGEKLTVGAVVLSPEFQAFADRLGADQVSIKSYPNLEAAIAGANPAQNGSATPNSDDCLLIAGPFDQLMRQPFLASLGSTPELPPVLVVTDSPQLEESVALIRQGVYSIVEANSPAAPTTVLETARKGRETFAKRKHLAKLKQQFAQLTPPERQVLDAMLDGMANKQIAQLLEIGLRTVELRRSKIMRKMNARSLAELIKFVCQVVPQVVAEPPTASDHETLNPVL